MLEEPWSEYIYIYIYCLFIHLLYVADGPRDLLPTGLMSCSLQLVSKPSSKGIPFGEDETACNRILWAMSLGNTNRNGT